MADENAVGNAICSICYEDLKPVVDHLQSISACGHVFHELCLQQWFEYCPSTNKRTCPICKQKCSLKDPCRLYFQSSGNQVDSVASQKVVDIEEDPALLRGEVKRLEGKILNLSSALEVQKKENVEVSNKLHEYKEQLKEEKEKRWEALQEKSTTQHLLKSKSEECDRITSQCTKLQERSMALAKELAALKLVSDLSLEEDDVLKLALLGNNAKTKDTIDTLVKSLVIRNSIRILKSLIYNTVAYIISSDRSYKELLAKCNQLGRGEARSSEKLEKAVEKIDRLKKRVRELEMASEERENRALRDIQVLKKCNDKEASEHANEGLASFRILPSDSISQKTSTPVGKSEKNDGISNEPSCFRGKEDSFISRKISVIEVEDDVPETTISGLRYSDTIMADQKGEDCNLQDQWCSIDNPLMKDIKFNIKNDSQSTASPRCNGAGDIMFSSGRTVKNLGRWSKRGENKDAASSLRSSIPGKNDLIAVGPDGKGGSIKVLRSQPQLSNVNTSSGTGKRLKLGSKTNGSSSQGCLQIEHFFGKSNR